MEDDTFYFAWWEPLNEQGEPLGTEVPHTDLTVLPAVNPSYGTVLQEPFYRDQLTKKSEAVYRRYFWNQWTEADEIWEAAQLWDELGGVPLERTEIPLFVGIDIGRRHDSAVVAWCQWLEEKVHVHQLIWSNPYRRGTAAYDSWRFRISTVEEVLRDLRERFPEAAAVNDDDEWLPGPMFLYDPHFFARSAEDLEGEGLNLVEWPQTDARMVPASQRLFDVIKVKELVHDGDPVARRHIRSVVAK